MPGTRGPAWVGLGAQRCGTTWFTDLLCVHPQVVLARNGKKEQHAFARSLLLGWSDDDSEAYRSRFSADPELRPGEFTPFYLRGAWVPPALVAAAPDALLLVLVRDPVERFVSAMRLHLAHRSFPGRDARAAVLDKWLRLHGVDQQWAGMYATQLRCWSEWVDPARLMVMQYEVVRADPQRATDAVWSRLGLDPVPLGAEVGRPSATSSSEAFELPESLRVTLASAYAPERDELRDRWGIDLALWGSSAA